MILHIIRHGETDLNKQSVVQGSGIDESLNENGVEQALAFYEYYKEEAYDYIFSSALKRSMETVKVWEPERIPIKATHKLNEIGWGVHEGRTISPDMTSRYTKLINDWYAGILTSRIEGGESAEELFGRLSEFIDDLRKLKAEKVLICTHGRTLRAFITLLLELPPPEMENFNHVNTGLYIVQLQERGAKLLLENDVQHLK